MPNNYFSLHTAFLGSSFFSLRVAVVMIACLDGDTLQNTKNGNLKSCLNCHVVEHTGDILGNKYGKDKSDNVERDSEKNRFGHSKMHLLRLLFKLQRICFIVDFNFKQFLIFCLSVTLLFLSARKLHCNDLVTSE